LNWYKQQSKIQKEAWNWDKFQKGVGFGAAVGLALWLGMSEIELQQMHSQLNGDDQAVIQALEEEVRNQGGDPQQLMQQNPSEVSENPEGTEVAQPAPTRPTPEEEEQAEANPEEAGEPPENANEKKKDYYEIYIDTLEEREGSWTHAYDDRTGREYNGGPRKGVITVGIGHAMGANPTDTDNHAPRSRRVFQELFGDSVNWDDIYFGKSELTEEQVQQLARYDIEKHVPRARNLIPNLDQQPEHIQHMAVDAVFRGDLGPLASDLIMQGQWMEAAKEYLNHQQYINAEELGIRGIIPRMEKNASQLVYHYIITNNIPRRNVPDLLRQYGLPMSILEYIYGPEGPLQER